MIIKISQKMDERIWIRRKPRQWSTQCMLNSQVFLRDPSDPDTEMNSERWCSNSSTEDISIYQFRQQGASG